MKHGFTLNDVGGALSWDALDAFVTRTEPASALSFELDPERAQWATTDGTNTILADIYDLLAVINHNMTALLSGKRPKKPKPYKRPGDDKKGRKHIGTASIPIGDMKAFLIRELRKRNGGRK